ncbi:MAG: hypothetical protein V4622_05530 [Bacteroidota bacterium]
MAVSICAFNSTELNNQELIDDGLNLFVEWELSDMFSDLLLSREVAMNNEQGELDQIASLLKIDIEAIYTMSNYWDKEQEIEHLSRHNNEDDRAKQLEIIQENNFNLIGNIDTVYETILSLEREIVKEEDLKFLLKKYNPGFYDDYDYFLKERKPYQLNLLMDLSKIKEFIEFVKPLDADTVYFKFKTII